VSTLRVSTLADTAGSNTSTPSEIASGRAKAWVNFNGTGTVAIRASYNVSSITDNGVGDYTVNFTNALADANYAAVAGAGNGDDTTSFINGVAQAAPTTSAVRLKVVNSSAVPSDRTYVHIAIFR
jgi:hypothetical protein